MDMELRNWVGKDFGEILTVFQMIRATQIDDVAELVVERTYVGK